MNTVNLIIAAGDFVIAVVTFGLSVPLYRKQVRLNHLYGIRIPKAFKSDDNWYAIIRYGAICLMGFAAAMTILSVAVLLMPPLEQSGWLVWLVALAPFLLMGTATLPIIIRYSRGLP